MFEEWVLGQWQKRALLAWLMLPFSLLYRLVLALRRALYQTGIKRSYTADVPVVVVGNIYLGGTGKTPVILSLIQDLQARGWHPGLISRGYGSEAKQHPACGTGQISAIEFGDEPAMLSALTTIPVSVHSNRPLAAKALLAFDSKIDVILSDDGLQHWALSRDLELLVQDERGCGNGWTLPAGPLREPPDRMTRVDAILTRIPAGQINGQTIEQPMNREPDCSAPRTESQTVQNARFAVQIEFFRHLATGRTVDASEFRNELGRERVDEVRVSGRPDDRTHAHGVLAMAGIGVPERFFSNLRLLGIHPSRTIALADHGNIDQSWLARQPEGTILMTEKDAIKLANVHERDEQTRAIHDRIWIACARTVWEDESLFDWLDRRLQERAKHLKATRHA